MRLAAVTLTTLVAVSSAAAQDGPASRPENASPQQTTVPATSAERPTGLPSQLKWTCNFDAGWGTFGFANSLFINPKDPGTNEDLSDQWFEGYVKPALTGVHTTGTLSELYGLEVEQELH